MRCPKCKSAKTHTYNSRKRPDGTVRRFRQCDECGEKFRTTEVNESHMTDLQEDITRLSGVKKTLKASIKQIGKAGEKVMVIAEDENENTS